MKCTSLSLSVFILILSGLWAFTAPPYTRTHESDAEISNLVMTLTFNTSLSDTNFFSVQTGGDDARAIATQMYPFATLTNAVNYVATRPGTNFILVGPGVFTLASNSVPGVGSLVLPKNIRIYGSGRGITIVHGTISGPIFPTLRRPIIELSDNAIVSSMTIGLVNTNDYAAIIGPMALVPTKYTNAVISDCDLHGNTDIYYGDGTYAVGVCQTKLLRCRLYSNFHTANQSGLAHIFEAFDCDFNVEASPAYPSFSECVVLNSGIGLLQNCRLTSRGGNLQSDCVIISGASTVATIVGCTMSATTTNPLAMCFEMSAQIGASIIADNTVGSVSTFSGGTITNSVGLNGHLTQNGGLTRPYKSASGIYTNLYTDSMVAFNTTGGTTNYLPDTGFRIGNSITMIAQPNHSDAYTNSDVFVAIFTNNTPEGFEVEIGATIPDTFANLLVYLSPPAAGGEAVIVNATNVVLFGMTNNSTIYLSAQKGTWATLTTVTQSVDTINGRVMTVFDATGNANAQNISIRPFRDQKILGSTSLAITGNYGSATLIASGTNWVNLGERRGP